MTASWRQRNLRSGWRVRQYDLTTSLRQRRRRAISQWIGVILYGFQTRSRGGRSRCVKLKLPMKENRPLRSPYKRQLKDAHRITSQIMSFLLALLYANSTQPLNLKDSVFLHVCFLFYFLSNTALCGRSPFLKLWHDVTETNELYSISSSITTGVYQINALLNSSEQRTSISNDFI